MSIRMTVRELVQSTLSAMDSDAVEFIGDTIESEQIALVCREVYHEIATYQDIPQFQQLTQLEGLQDTNRRTVMRIPDECTDIYNIRYLRVVNDREVMEDINFVERHIFYDTQWGIDNSNPNVEFNILEGGIRVPYRTDRPPRCWTTFDDEYIVFDAIDRSVDDTLHNDASACLAYIIPEFRIEDDFIPDLPEKMFPQYLQQIKEVAFLEKKQTVNPLEREKRRRSEHRNRHLVSINDGLDNGQQRPIYGRRGVGFGSSHRSNRSHRGNPHSSSQRQTKA